MVKVDRKAEASGEQHPTIYCLSTHGFINNPLGRCLMCTLQSCTRGAVCALAVAATVTTRQ
eukprot:399063-Pyramimonas_sp.AAC.2